MKRILLLIVVIILVLSAVACNKLIENKVDELVEKKLGEALDDKDNKDVDKDNDSNHENTEFDNSLLTEKAKWSNDISDDFEEFDYGTLRACQNNDDTWFLLYTDVEEDDIEEYLEMLEDDDWEWEQAMDNAYEAIKDDLEIIFLIGGEDKNGDSIVSVYLDNHDNDDRDGNGDGNSMDINYDNLEDDIPSDYPMDEVPIYDDGKTVVLGGNEQNAGGTIMYSVVIATDTETDEVLADIIQTMKKLSNDAKDGSFTDVTVGGVGMVIGSVDDWDYSIGIGDGKADGYTTVVTYTISERK
ncbi:MAG: hypothetical protein KAQ68_00610 [Clostridiales bacterium]|nr:hypothetical protein [Clostridiales bacterium]